ncbi:hypothetical protein [Echinimonas agarilytica]|uniref:Uncharacterized protein n=1 Tax=Echinimonas agarilytica TaxID=1215918 RepID=A0AA41W7M4_9GAMM|nr:hypothetical protein [Echinimonas agarilytica]MCM2680046.1 hypothetical protein [Echinimonas agarilytica]
MELFKIFLRFFGIFGLLMCWPCIGLAKELASIELIAPEQSSVLADNSGYAVFSIDVAGAAPSLELIRLRTPKTLMTGNENPPATLGKTIALDMTDRAKGIYLVALAAGEYQIVTVKAPFFNLPYFINTEYARNWRFNVAPQRINYAGFLSIQKERGRDFIDIQYLNRLATDLSAIEDELEEQLKVYPLRSGAVVNDDFYTELVSTGNPES